MSRKANPTLIGLFIVLGLALGVGAVLYFSSAKLFTHSRRYVMYFDASLTGLERGAVVKYRGVTIGSVKEVLVHLNQAPEDSSLPVLIELNGDLVRDRSDGGFNLMEEGQLEAYVKRGLRGKLDAQSLLTGVLYVNLEFLPQTPVIYRQLKKVYPEIPTSPTDVQIFRVDFAAVAQKLNVLLAKLDSSLNELQVREINRGITNLLISLNVMVNSPELTNTLASARQTFEDVRSLSIDLRSKVDSLAKGADLTLTDSRETLAEIRQGVRDVREVIGPQTPLRQDLSAALEQLAEAARSASALADFLNRHPNALISGKKAPDSKP